MTGRMDDLRTLIAGLDEWSLLRSFADAELELLLRAAKRRDLKRGEDIIRQGDEGGFAVALLSGHLKVSIISPNGREIILAYADPGEVLGEIALIDKGPRTASVTAIEPAIVLVIPAQAFEAAAMASPSAMLRMLQVMASRIRQLNLMVEGDRAFSAAPRLARVLVRLMDDAGKLRFSPNQSELGAFAGMARENVNRILTDWEGSGLLRRSGRSLEILDPGYIRELAEFGDPDTV